LWRTSMNQDWIDPHDDALPRPAGPSPFARRLRALLHREEPPRASPVPPPPPHAATPAVPPEGRFTRDNPGGSGHPLTRRLVGLRLALVRAGTAEDIAGLTRVLAAKAEAGDLPAPRLLFSYLLHQPAAAPAPVRRPRVDSAQVQEWLSVFMNDAEGRQL